jgi:hypothetical protein
MLSFEDIDLTKENSVVGLYRNELNLLYPKLNSYSYLAVTSENHWKFISNLLHTSRSVELVALKDQKWYKSERSVIGKISIF